MKLETAIATAREFVDAHAAAVRLEEDGASYAIARRALMAVFGYDVLG